MTLRLNGDGSGFTEIKAADTAGDNSIKLPASNGSAYQLLRNGSSAGELAYESDLRVDGTGNVGVGVDPAYSGVFGGSQRVLHIGGTAAPGVRITSSTSDQGDFIIQAGNSGKATYVESLAENGDIAFFTRPTGGNVTERFRIKGSGQIALSANCPGIDFSGIQTSTTNGTTASELLDSYEEGVFVPVLRGSGTPGTYTASRDTVGRYIKVGRMVFATVDFNAGNFSGSTGAIQITNLPFTVASDGAGAQGDIPYASFHSAMMYNISFDHTHSHSWYLNPGGTIAYGIESRPGTTWTDWASSNFHNSSIYFTQTFVYMAAA